MRYYLGPTTTEATSGDAADICERSRIILITPSCLLVVIFKWPDVTADCREELFSQEQKLCLFHPRMFFIVKYLTKTMQHLTSRQVVSSLAPKPTKDFRKGIQMNLWHQRKVKKSDYFSHLFLVSMVSVFDSSHIPTCASVGFRAGRLSNLHFQQVSWTHSSSAKLLFKERASSYRQRKSRTLISQIKTAAIHILILHSFNQNIDKEKGTDTSEGTEYESPAQMEYVIHKGMNETFVFTPVFCYQHLWCFCERILIICWRCGHPNHQYKYANLSKNLLQHCNVGN